MVMKTVIQLVLCGGTIYLLVNLYALWISDRLLFAPRYSSYRHLPNEVRIPTGDGETITAVYLEHPAPK